MYSLWNATGVIETFHSNIPSYAMNIFVTSKDKTETYFTRQIPNIDGGLAYNIATIPPLPIDQNGQIEAILSFQDLTNYNLYPTPPSLELTLYNASWSTMVPIRFDSSISIQNLRYRTASLPLPLYGPTSVFLDRLKMGI